MFVCNKWIIKLRKCLFAINELWKHEHFCLYYMNSENMKVFVCNTWIMKRGKYHFAIHYEHFCLQNMNYEDMKIFVCNTWIMKIFVGITLIMKKLKCLFAIHELWKYLLALH